MEMSKVDDWLEGIPSKATRKSYLNGLKTFEKFHDNGVETLIGNMDAGKIVEKFYAWMKQEGYKQNTARVKANAVIQFLKYFDTPVKYRKSIGIYRSEIATGEHPLTVSELQEMASTASLKEQVLLSIFIMGLRVSDACRLEWRTFDVRDQEPPVPVEIMTRKEGQLAKTFVSAEFKEILEKFIPTLDRENKYLLQSARKGHLDEESLNWTLKELSRRANLKLRGRLHWHSGRKLFIRTASSLGINQWNARMMIGKSVSKDILTYVNGVNLSKDFSKVSEVLKLKPAKGGNRVGDVEKTVNLLKETLTTLEKENAILKTRIDNLQDSAVKLEDSLNDVRGYMASHVEFSNYTEEEKEAIRRRYNLREYTDEEKQQMYDLTELVKEIQGEKGYMTKEDDEELKRRFAERLRKREKAKQRTKRREK